MYKSKIAVIGSGITGLSISYILSNKYDVHLFEKNKALGGHTRTKYINESNIMHPIDTGFIVFNEKNYPDLTCFFKLLNINYSDSDMSFSVSNKKLDLEYGGKNFFTLFAQKKNLFSLKYLKMLQEIYKFYKLCDSTKIDKKLSKLNLKQFLDKYNFSENIRISHIYPMVSAIWSNNQNYIQNLPFKSFVNFFQNHGLFNLKNRPKWKYVNGGSQKYIDAIIKKKLFKFYTNIEILKIYRHNNKIEFFDFNNQKYNFDKIIFATHADQILDLLSDPSQKEIENLSKFKYTKNAAFLHTDNNLMPSKKIAWSSWNVLQTNNSNKNLTLTYWMNNLQKLKTKKDYFVTINPPHEPNNILDNTIFEHPIFSLETINAQKNIRDLQGFNNSYFCGSYLGYGFHEDGIQSAAYIANLLDVELPWKRSINFKSRLHF
tara:strand:+ start:702 stop:1994 length:1293 start_codon:yes stop_codon:yes gene_type:complete